MSTKNLIKKEQRFSKEYIATVVSNDDPLRRGRLQVTVDTILGDIPFWVDSTLLAGSVQLIVIPNAGDKVTVKFKNKDIYSGEWELKGTSINGTDEANIDPTKYGLKDTAGNFVLIDKTTNDISINSLANINLTAATNANMTFTGNLVLQAEAGTINYNGSLDLTSPTVTIHGNVTIDGNLEVLGTTNLQGTSTFEGISWAGHVHPYTWTDGAGQGNTSPPQ